MDTEAYRKKENYVQIFSPETRVNDPVGHQDFDYKHCRKYGLLDKWNGKRLLHVGCNSGGNSVALSWEGIRVIGVDINERAIEEARRSAKNHRIKMRFYTANMIDMSLPRKRFDAMFCSNVLEHLYPEDLNPALLNLKKHMKRNASFYISVPKGNAIPDRSHTIIFNDVKPIIRHFSGNVVEGTRHFIVYQ